MRAIAKQIGIIAQEYSEDTDPLIAAGAVVQRLFDYSHSLEAWARDIAGIMVQRAADNDYKTWIEASTELSKDTRKRLREVGTGDEFTRLQNEQVTLITSLPLDAAKKVHEWTKEGMVNGDRYLDIAKRIRTELGGVSDSRAILIARTETSRARASFTEARAKAIGSTHYVWHTVGDADVRPRHAHLDGTIQAWDNPPVCDHGKGGKPIRSNPGAVFNCRCWAQPLFPKSEYEK